MDEQQNELEISKEGMKAKGKDITFIVLVMIVGLLVGIGAIGYLHAQDQRAHADDARIGRAELVSAMKDQTKAIQDQTAAQREATCIQIFKDPTNCQRIR